MRTLGPFGAPSLATITPGEPEIFVSLQGEGPSAGKPCAFVRLSRCSLACVWCDTAYTWRFEGDNRPHRADVAYDRTANQVTLGEEEVAQRIAALGKPRLVVTGGEPLLQAPALARMLARLPGMAIEIETNGTVAPPPALDALVGQYNVSPSSRIRATPRPSRSCPSASKPGPRSRARFSSSWSPRRSTRPRSSPSPTASPSRANAST